MSTSPPSASYQRPVLAHAIHSGGFYGAEKVILDLAEMQLRHPGLTVVFISFLDPDQGENEISRRLATLGIKVIPFPVSRGFRLSACFRYGRLLREHSVRLLHSHGYKVTFYHTLSRILGLHKVPIVVTAHGYSKSSGNWRSALYRRLDNLAFSHVGMVAAVSREMYDYIRMRNPKCRVATVENGISTRITVKGVHPLWNMWHDKNREIPIIGSIGRLVPMKNHSLLLRAFADISALRPCRLAIIGDGPLRSSLEEMCRKLAGCGEVRLLPFQADILEWMNDLDVFCLPSNDGEGLPMALLEAGLLGKPVVCSRSGGIPEVIRDGENGRLFDLGDREGLVRCLLEVIDHPDRGRSMGLALRRSVLEKHDIQATHRRYLDIYSGAGWPVPSAVTSTGGE